MPGREAVKRSFVVVEPFPETWHTGVVVRMEREKRRLRTSTILAAGMLATVGAAVPATAAEVLPGGVLDLTITGSLRFLAHGGQLDDARQENEFSRSLDFSNDTELNVLARARSEKYGFEYGGAIQFLADTDETINTDTSWIFVSGGWGEVRLGDEDGVADNSSVGAQTIAAGTGGIDGDVVDEIAVGVVYLTHTDTATKIRYYTPSFAGFSVGVDYTPTLEEVDSGDLNGQFFARKDGLFAMQAKNVFEGGLIYEDELAADVDLLASVVGVSGTLTNRGEEEFADDEDDFGDKNWWGWQAGVSADVYGFRFAGSFADEEVGELERTFYTLGIGYGDEDTFNTSVTYGQVIDSTGTPFDKPYNLVFSADYALMPGLLLIGDVGLFDNDGTEPGYQGGDKGWQAVVGLDLEF
jgi:outer membrane protein OmpU